MTDADQGCPLWPGAIDGHSFLETIALNDEIFLSNAYFSFNKIGLLYLSEILAIFLKIAMKVNKIKW
jgi:hypothetical protein